MAVLGAEHVGWRNAPSSVIWLAEVIANADVYLDAVLSWKVAACSDTGGSVLGHSPENQGDGISRRRIEEKQSRAGALQGSVAGKQLRDQTGMDSPGWEHKCRYNQIITLLGSFRPESPRLQ